MKASPTPALPINNHTSPNPALKTNKKASQAPFKPQAATLQTHTHTHDCTQAAAYHGSGCCTDDKQPCYPMRTVPQNSLCPQGPQRGSPSGFPSNWPPVNTVTGTLTPHPAIRAPSEPLIYSAAPGASPPWSPPCSPPSPSPPRPRPRPRLFLLRRGLRGAPSPASWPSCPSSPPAAA